MTELEKYCIDHSTIPSEKVRELGAFTQSNLHGSQMLIGELEASLMGLLIKLGGIKEILEIGTYSGYSALAMAENLPEDGNITTIDINPQSTKVAQDFWAQSPHGKKINLILKPALDALREINRNFDLIFIDADKNNYPHYLDWAVEHLNPKGLIIIDNTLWHGKVLTPGIDKQTDSIILTNKKAYELEGFVKTLLPLRDGMMLLTRI